MLQRAEEIAWFLFCTFYIPIMFLHNDTLAEKKGLGEFPGKEPVNLRILPTYSCSSLGPTGITEPAAVYPQPIPPT